MWIGHCRGIRKLTFRTLAFVRANQGIVGCVWFLYRKMDICQSISWTWQSAWFAKLRALTHKRNSFWVRKSLITIDCPQSAHDLYHVQFQYDYLFFFYIFIYSFIWKKEIIIITFFYTTDTTYKTNITYITYLHYLQYHYLHCYNNSQQLTILS